MAIALDPNRTFDYVLKCDRGLPREQQSVFHIRPLSALEMRHLKNAALTIDQVTQQAHSYLGDLRYLALRAGLVGWSNFKRADGTEAVFERTRQNLLGRSGEVVTDACLDLLRDEWRDELAEAVQEFNTLTRDDAKN